LQDEIETALRPLVGLDLVNTGRAANIQWFTFGRHASAEQHDSDLADFAVHVICPWRLVRDGHVLVGNADYYRPASEDVSDDEFNAATIGSRAIDERIVQVRSDLNARRHVVKACLVNALGFVLMMDATALEVFPDGSSVPHSELEFWRVFQPDLAALHFVVK
jgi:hypothetical protein